MTIEWNAHRFSGGVLVLDLINTVIYRDDPARRMDRLESLGQVDRFANAAATFRRPELGAALQFQNISEAQVDILIKLRESADNYFRPLVRKGNAGPKGLANLLMNLAVAVRDSEEFSFVRQVALSTLRHMGEPHMSKTRICPNCHWLFLDRSKNSSRIWCDMSVCGNRHKARLNYVRQRTAELSVEQ